MALNKETKISNFLIIQRIWKHLSKRKKKYFFLILFIMLLSGIAELLSLASLLPLLTVITNPNRLLEISIIEKLGRVFGIYNPSEFVLPTTILFVFAILSASSIRLLSLWSNGKFAASVGAEFSYEVYKRNLLQPYEIHINRNTSKVIAATTSQLDTTVIAINLMLQMLTGIIVATSLIIALIITSKLASTYLIFTFGIAYLFFIFLIKKTLLRDSFTISSKNKKILKILQESLGGIREIIMGNSHEIYLRNYRENDFPLKSAKQKVIFISSSPRIVLEALGIITIALAAYSMSLSYQDSLNLIPILGSFVLGAQKLLPALQQIYSSWAGIRSSIGSAIDVLDMLDQDIPKYFPIPKRFNMKKSVNLVNVSFNYQDKNDFVIEECNLEIKKGEKLGIIGDTGSGKTTLINIIMGLLYPRKGFLEIDQKKIVFSSKVKGIFVSDWRHSISYVPQSIFLKDASILENIAFEESFNKIDYKKVKKVAKQAQIDRFIESLEFGYKTIVGEKGVKLSGGEKQRIGIARALYKENTFLILDEATSALDNKTEYNVMKSINNLGAEVTVLIIAHRLSTLKKCTKVIELHKGKIINSSIPEEIINKGKFNN